MPHVTSRSLRIVFICASLVVLMFPSTLPHAAAKTSGPTVQMKEFKFLPAAITVRAGQTVTWTYNESITDPMPNCETLHTPIPGAGCPGHSTTAVAKGPNGKPVWDSGVHYADGFPFRFTFTKPGTYKYYCIPHGGPNDSPLTHMDGVVTVK